MKTLRQGLNQVFGKPRRSAPKSYQVAIMPDGTEYQLVKRGLGIRLDDGLYAETVKSARDHFARKGARIERRKFKGAS